MVRNAIGKRLYHRRRRYRPRFFRRKSRRYRAIRRSTRIGKYAGFPSHKTVSLRYADTYDLTPASAGALAENVFKINSVFDPDDSGLGHQPLGFDEWAIIYNRYVVKGAKITAKFQCSGTTGLPILCGILLDNNNSLTTAVPSAMIENGRSAYCSIRDQINESISPTMKKYFSAKKWFGVKDVNDNGNLKALTTSNPVSLAYAHVWACDATGTAVDDTIYATVVIDYIVEFSEPKDIAQS